MWVRCPDGPGGSSDGTTGLWAVIRAAVGHERRVVRPDAGGAEPKPKLPYGKSNGSHGGFGTDDQGESAIVGQPAPRAGIRMRLGRGKRRLGVRISSSEEEGCRVCWLSFGEAARWSPVRRQLEDHACCPKE